MIDAILNLYLLVILARVFMSWIPNLDPYNPIAQALYQVTEPVLEPIRGLLSQILPPSMGMLDLSPIIVFFIIRMLQSLF